MEEMTIHWMLMNHNEKPGTAGKNVNDEMVEHFASMETMAESISVLAHCALQQPRTVENNALDNQGGHALIAIPLNKTLYNRLEES